MANSEAFKKGFDPADYGCCRVCCEPVDKKAEVCPSCGGDYTRSKLLYTVADKHEIRRSYRVRQLMNKINGRCLSPAEYFEFNNSSSVRSKRES